MRYLILYTLPNRHSSDFVGPFDEYHEAEAHAEWIVSVMGEGTTYKIEDLIPAEYRAVRTLPQRWDFRFIHLDNGSEAYVVIHTNIEEDAWEAFTKRHGDRTGYVIGSVRPYPEIKYLAPS